jgi:uncharacterized NAD(P)/FAD-binding protein YdhS
MALRQRIGIVGGGFSGTLCAYHLEKLGGNNEVVIIEPKAALGMGLAYSTPSMRHLLNVPAGKISALPDRPTHFLDWLHKNNDPSAEAGDFIPRAVFGRYVQGFAAKLTRTEHLHALAVACNPEPAGLRLHLSDRRSLVVDKLILALGNFEPAPFPGVAPACKTNGSYHNCAWRDQTFTGLPDSAPVLLIGTGLTAIDVVLRFREQGHRGVITAVSRHGIFPSRHSEDVLIDQKASANFQAQTARGLLQAFRQAIADNRSWRTVVDELRPYTNEIWQSLPQSEQIRFRRHLLRRWETLRHRMAPAIANQLDEELRAGTLIRRSGRIVGIHHEESGARVDILDEGGNKQRVNVQRVINCTGPNMNYTVAGNPLLDSLFAQKLIAPGNFNIGLWTDDEGAVRSAAGVVSDNIFTLGPARLGNLLESIAVPELREQSLRLAIRLSTGMATADSSRSAA